MAEVTEPDYDDAPPALTNPSPAVSQKADSTSNPAEATPAAPASASDSLRQQIEAQIEGHTEAAKQLTEDEKKEVDARSVHVAGVDYSVIPADLQHLFEKCGEIVRVKILTDKTGRPKGFAYIEFAHMDSVARALELTDSVLKSRKITVTQKRTNVPGMKRGGGTMGGGNFRGGFMGYVPVPYGMMPTRGRGGPHRSQSQRGRGRTNPY
jgi:polyadenylate-binding protein 2